MSKRTLDSFFTSASKRAKISPPPVTRKATSTPVVQNGTDLPSDISVPSTSSFSHHKTYPHPIADLPTDLAIDLTNLITTTTGTSITNQPHLDLLHFQPFMPRSVASQLFIFLRSSLPFYRVRYTISRFGKDTVINTPRYTTVFGLDETSHFDPAECPSESSIPVSIVDNTTNRPATTGKYKCHPRPMPKCLALLKHVTEAATNTSYNFCLVNYYATGADSISFHSDDERFLGPNPAIASFSLGAKRDFLMKHKPPAAMSQSGNKGSTAVDMSDANANAKSYPNTTPLKFPLGSGDMILMRGETQANWLHSIPKRTGKGITGSEAAQGRINITFRKAMVPGGTENYYRYNVGDGGVYRWDDKKGEMVEWTKR